MAGRPPKPTAIKIMEGNRGHRPLNDNEPICIRGEIIKPDFLDELAGKAWDSMVDNMQKMNLLSLADLDAMSMYCTLFSRWLQAERVIREQGMVFDIMDNQGNFKYSQQRPEVGIANQCIKQMTLLASQFGMTPASRSKLMVLAADKDKDTRDFEDLLA